MGIRKYRSVEDMPGPEPRPPLRPENLREAFALMDTAIRLSRIVPTPGVRKYRSLEELDADREKLDREVARRRRESG